MTSRSDSVPDWMSPPAGLGLTMAVLERNASEPPTVTVEAVELGASRILALLLPMVPPELVTDMIEPCTANVPGLIVMVPVPCAVTVVEPEALPIPAPITILPFELEAVARLIVGAVMTLLMVRLPFAVALKVPPEEPLTVSEPLSVTYTPLVPVAIGAFAVTDEAEVWIGDSEVPMVLLLVPATLLRISELAETEQDEQLMVPDPLIVKPIVPGLLPPTAPPCKAMLKLLVPDAG